MHYTSIENLYDIIKFTDLMQRMHALVWLSLAVLVDTLKKCYHCVMYLV